MALKHPATSTPALARNKRRKEYAPRALFRRQALLKADGKWFPKLLRLRPAREQTAAQPRMDRDRRIGSRRYGPRFLAAVARPRNCPRPSRQARRWGALPQLVNKQP